MPGQYESVVLCFSRLHNQIGLEPEFPEAIGHLKDAHTHCLSLLLSETEGDCAPVAVSGSLPSFAVFADFFLHPS